MEQGPSDVSMDRWELARVLKDAIDNSLELQQKLFAKSWTLILVPVVSFLQLCGSDG